MKQCVKYTDDSTLILKCYFIVVSILTPNIYCVSKARSYVCMPVRNTPLEQATNKVIPCMPCVRKQVGAVLQHQHEACNYYLGVSQPCCQQTSGPHTPRRAGPLKDAPNDASHCQCGCHWCHPRSRQGGATINGAHPGRPPCLSALSECMARAAQIDTLPLTFYASVASTQ